VKESKDGSEFNWTHQLVAYAYGIYPFSDNILIVRKNKKAFLYANRD
jgi:hypothetical protein